MVERVAKTISDTITKDEWNNIGENAREVYRMAARNVLSAMREPSGAMKEAGTSFVYEGWASSESGQKSIATESWQAMIDAAVKAP